MKTYIVGVHADKAERKVGIDDDWIPGLVEEGAGHYAKVHGRHGHAGSCLSRKPSIRSDKKILSQYLIPIFCMM